MLSEKKTTESALILVFLFFLGLSLFINLPALQKQFLFSDEAIYYSMTQSLAQDGDLEYTKKDLTRYYEVFGSGPLGIFLKKGKEGKIFFAKSFAYPVFAAPFVKVFGTNGFFVFHSLLLLLFLLMGYSYFSLANRPSLSLGLILSLLFASVTIVYFLWITPDFFNFVLVFSVLFLWLFKLKSREQEKVAPEGSREHKKPFLHRFLLSDSSDYLASFCAAIAVFSKPPNIVLMGPLVLYTLLKKRYFKSLAMIGIFLLTSGLFWGTNSLITGDWNYQGGERRTFYFNYPLEKEGMTFDTLGGEMTSRGYAEKHLFPPKVVLSNVFYYFFGRFTGIAWYFFPAILSLFLFLSREKKLAQWLILGALAGEILIYVILMPDNYAGGGGALANRYFLNIYPLFLFLPYQKRNPREIAAIWVMASLFISPILVNPLLHSHFPSTHAKKLPFKLLPVELTLVNNLPTNTNPYAFRQEMGTPPHIGWLHFLDDNFHPRLEPNGFWTRGPNEAEMILKTYYPVEKLVFHLLNNPRMENEVSVEVEGHKKKITLGKKQRGTLTFPAGKGFKMRAIHLYRIKVKASKGALPYLEEEANKERRFLGVFFEMEIIPQKNPHK